MTLHGLMFRECPRNLRRAKISISFSVCCTVLCSRLEGQCFVRWLVDRSLKLTNKFFFCTILVFGWTVTKHDVFVCKCYMGTVDKLHLCLWRLSKIPTLSLEIPLFKHYWYDRTMKAATNDNCVGQLWDKYDKLCESRKK